MIIKTIMKLFRFILSLFIPLFLISCENRYEKITYYDTGEIKEKYEYPTKLDFNNNQNYTAYCFYKDGKIENHTTIRNGKREEEYLSYYPNGVLKNIIIFKNGVKNGIEKYFTINGDIIQEDFFINDVPMTRMKSFNSENERVDIYYYIENDTLIKNGRLIYNNQNKIIPEKSFYYSIDAKDTLSSNEEYSFELKVYTYGEKNVIKEFDIGDFDEKYNFIDTTKLIKLESKNNSIKYSLKPTKKGYNLIMGKINVEGDANIDGNIKTQSRQFIFCTEFYVAK